MERNWGSAVRRPGGIRQLELEGLVQLIPNKSLVTGNFLKRRMDMYQIRAKLEGLCAAMAAENITKEQLEEMEEAVYLSDFHADKGNYEQVCQQDGRFHQLYIRHQEAGFWRIPFPIFTNICRESEWLL